MPWLGVHKPEDIKQAEWLVAAALHWRCLTVTPASFLDELLCDAWHGPLLLLQQDLGHCFADVRAYAITHLLSTAPGMQSLR